MNKLQDDLTDAKESYLNLASENKALENQVRLEGEQEMEQRMKEVREGDVLCIQVIRNWILRKA